MEIKDVGGTLGIIGGIGLIGLGIWISKSIVGNHIVGLVRYRFPMVIQ